ncbi:hypothetical protein SCARD494_00272 [Seiridium cardinale]
MAGEIACEINRVGCFARKALVLVMADFEEAPRDSARIDERSDDLAILDDRDTAELHIVDLGLVQIQTMLWAGSGGRVDAIFRIKAGDWPGPSQRFKTVQEYNRGAPTR